MMRLLCDEMLAGLCRWLRAAGHDARLAERGAPDASLLTQMRDEGRVLLTQDKHLAAEAGADACLLPEDGLDAQALRLANDLGVDWCCAPFTRCVLDNAPLRAATAEERLAVPPGARDLEGSVTACPACGRVYWPGSHHRRMAERLAGWASAASNGDRSAEGAD